MMAEVSFTAGDQKDAAQALEVGDRGVSCVGSEPQPIRITNGVARSEWDAVPGEVGMWAPDPMRI